MKDLFAILWILCLCTLWTLFRQSRDLNQCERNLNQLAFALEMYASDPRGLYPPSLELLVRLEYNQLKAVPTCPSSGQAPLYWCTTTPDGFDLHCQGHHFYDGDFGFVDEPSAGKTAKTGLLPR